MEGKILKFSLDQLKLLGQGVREYMRNNSCESQLDNSAELLARINHAQKNKEVVADTAI